MMVYAIDRALNCLDICFDRARSSCRCENVHVKVDEALRTEASSAHTPYHRKTRTSRIEAPFYMTITSL